uniref:C2H2-type domain-containing protein n=1 Tax=Trichobilharzia regenti TaxID=157069 RepID=A0AA85J1A2_TRIRE|nr:unnamed protein product [Trichobilharzia regenti]
MDTSAVDLSSQIHLKVEQPVQSDDLISKSLEKYDVKRDENVEMENHSKVEGNPEQISECGIINSNDNINNNNTCSNDVGVVVVKKRNPKRRNPPKESKVFQCIKCHSCYTSRTFLKIHTKFVHKDVDYTCPQCCKTFAEKYELEIHQAIIHGVSRFKCEQCSQCFLTNGALKSHNEVVHLVEGNPEQISECGIINNNDNINNNNTCSNDVGVVVVKKRNPPKEGHRISSWRHEISVAVVFISTGGVASLMPNLPSLPVLL